MIKYVMLNINSILNNVRNYLADIYFSAATKLKILL